MDTIGSFDSQALDTLRNHPQLAPFASELLLRASQAAEVPAYLNEVLPAILTVAEGDSVALAAARRGQWAATAQAGDARPLPTDLLAEVLDREAPSVQDGWAASSRYPTQAQSARPRGGRGGRPPLQRFFFRLLSGGIGVR